MTERVFYKIEHDSKFEILIRNGEIKQKRGFKRDKETGNFPDVYNIFSNYTCNLSGNELIKFLKVQGYNER